MQYKWQTKVFSVKESLQNNIDLFQEWKYGMPKRNFEYLLRQFKTKYDKNKDGKISSDEWHTWVTGELILLCYKQNLGFLINNL